jgi:Phytanoyl-CoA dioxygenase (PhyH)
MSLAPSVAPDWPSVFREIDRPASAWTPETLRGAYVRHGCAVARGAIDAEAIARVRQITSEVYARTGEEHVHEPDIAAASGGRVSGFDLVANPLLARFLDRIFVGQRFRRENATARRVASGKPQQGWQPPLALHVDSFFHEFWFTVNFWVPFDACGVEAPGLQLLPIDYRQTRRYAGFSRKPVYPRREDFENSRHFPTDSLNVDDVERDFGPGCLFRPAMNPGDVILSSNWVVHGSYRTAEMSKGRASIELRFIGTCPDIAVKPDASDAPRIAAWFMANRVAAKLRKPTRTGLPFWADRM